MPLVDYSSSDASDLEIDVESTNAHPPTPSSDGKDRSRSTTSSSTLKRKCDANHGPDPDLPPLPSHFHDLYASTTRASTRDDPSLHGGRRRATPHVEGNWPTHLYIEWVLQPSEYDALTQLIVPFQTNSTDSTTVEAEPDTARSETTSLLTSDLGAPLPLHISLSRPIGFKTEEKDGFVAALRRSVTRCGVRPFEIHPVGLDWVPNFEGSRWFLVLRLARPPDDGLNRLLRVCNAVVEEWGQGMLYARPPQHCEAPEKRSRKKWSPTAAGGSIADEDKQDLSDSFHVSIAWTLDAPSAEASQLVRAMAQQDAFKVVKEIELSIDEIKVKVGNVVTTLKLPVKAVETPNLFGF